MSERKVLSKYYPPDFDPSKISRKQGRGKPKPQDKFQKIRLGAPFSMQCTQCGEFIYKGRKFNANKETSDEKYLDITIFRFHIKCTRCSSPIVFRTDPKHNDYVCVSGAIRNFEPWREYREEETDEQKLDRLEAEAAEEEIDKMAELETKVVDAKTEMAVGDALDAIRASNARREAAAKNSTTGAVMTAEELKQKAEEDWDAWAHEEWVKAKAKQMAKKAIADAERKAEESRKMHERVAEHNRQWEERIKGVKERNPKRKREEAKAAIAKKKIKPVDSPQKEAEVPKNNKTSKSAETTTENEKATELPKRAAPTNNMFQMMADLYPSSDEED